MRFPKPTTFLAIAAACFAIAGCNDEINPPTTPTTGQASVRFVNAMSGTTTTPLNLTTNGSQGTNVAYSNYGGCTTVSSGATNFSIGQSGSTTALATIPSTNLASGGHYTIVATGSVTSPQYLVLNDAYSTPSSGNALVRVVNTASTTPFDVYIGAPGAVLGTTVQSNTAFNTSNNYITAPSGTNQVTFTGVGTQTILGTTTGLSLSTSTPETIFVTPATTVGGLLNYFAAPVCP